MKFKHTPAPWLTDRNNTHTGQIATVHGCENNSWVEIWSTNWPESESVQEANANLIAAAPELLALLMKLDRIGGLGLSTHKEIQSVIAKALGQQ